jgi:hypothetical protein
VPNVNNLRIGENSLNLVTLTVTERKKVIHCLTYGANPRYDFRIDNYNASVVVGKSVF